MVDYMDARSAARGEPWARIARHMLGLRNGPPGARRWRQVWSRPSPEGRAPREVPRLAAAALQQGLAGPPPLRRRVRRAAALPRDAASGQHDAGQRERERGRLRRRDALAEKEHADRGRATGRNTVNTPADDAGTCCSPVIHSQTVTTLAAMRVEQQQPRRPGDGAKSKRSACHSANGATSTRPQRLMSALMRFGRHLRRELLADDDVDRLADHRADEQRVAEQRAAACRAPRASATQGDAGDRAGDAGGHARRDALAAGTRATAPPPPPASPP